MSNSIALLLVLFWPLLLACILVYTKSRLMALRLVPWAAAPALVLALGVDDTFLGLSGALLDGALRLDFTGRAFLLLAAVLSLASGLLARMRIADSAGGIRFALFLLLSMTGAFGLALAGDALLFFTAATLFGYSVYGLHASGAELDSGVARRARRIFIASLVVSDLIVFELLLVLSHNAGGTTFAELRHTLLLTEYPGTTLALLLFGFGIKIGLLGAHLWLAPVFLTASPPVLPMLLGFVFCTGILGFLRLLPLGEVYWPGAGQLLQWLALATLVYAIPAGVMQAHPRSVLAYGVMALSALFLWLLDAVLAEPTLWTRLYTVTHFVIVQTGLAMALLLLLPGNETGYPATRLQHSLSAAGWLAALILLAVPVEIIASIGGHAPAMTIGHFGLYTFLALLMARSLQLNSTTTRVTREQVLAVAGLSLAALPIAVHAFLLVPVSELGRALLYLLPAVFIGLLGGPMLVKHLPTLPAGDLLGPVERSITALVYALYELADKQLPRLLNNTLGVLHRCYAEVRRRDMLGRLETLFGHWHIAMLMLVILGLSIAIWSSKGNG